MRKRFTLPVVALLLLLGIPPARAQGVFILAAQDALAIWIFLGPDGGTMYLAGGLHYVEPQFGMGTVGFIGKGPCEVRRGGRSISCEASARGVSIPPEAFRFDPLLEAAVLDIETKGFLHHIEWTGQGPGPGAGVGMGAGVDPAGVAWADAQVGLARSAEALGEVFGLQMEQATDDLAFLSQGVMAGAFIAQLAETAGRTFHLRARLAGPERDESYEPIPSAAGTSRSERTRIPAASA